MYFAIFNNNKHHCRRNKLSSLNLLVHNPTLRHFENNIIKEIAVSSQYSKSKYIGLSRKKFTLKINDSWTFRYENCKTKLIFFRYNRKFLSTPSSSLVFMPRTKRSKLLKVLGQNKLQNRYFWGVPKVLWPVLKSLLLRDRKAKCD